MRRACVIGWPIGHSRSPLIHGYWLQRYGIDGAYSAEAVEPARATEFLRTLEIRGLVGANVTVPHKEAAFATADVLEPTAEAVGAANTVWLEGGRLHAGNTDAYGFITHLTLSVPDWPKNEAALVLGAGGAARAVVYALLEAGVPHVIVCNRSVERAEALARAFGDRYPARLAALPWAGRNRAALMTGLIVNTTTLGLKGVGSPEIDFSGAYFSDPSIWSGGRSAQGGRATVVYDLVYVPLETAFLKAARKAGLRTVDGLGMLLHQGAPGFERWFGVKPEVTPELRALLVRDIEGAR